MDDSVIASMVKWPNVPDCYGWLHLDAQGRWRLGQLQPSDNKDQPTPHPAQQQKYPQAVTHEALKAYINRNYCTPTPSKHPLCWALQNGPQRVWVTLALAPLIVHLHRGIASAHTGDIVNIVDVYLSDDGVVYFATDAGPAALASTSMEAFSQGLNNDSNMTHMVWHQTPMRDGLIVKSISSLKVEFILGFKRCAIPAPLA